MNCAPWIENFCECDENCRNLYIFQVKWKRERRALPMSLRPDFCAPRLADVPLTALGGARVLLLDADNTLAPWRGAVPDPAAARWVESAKAAGFRLCIASNSDAERLRPLEEALGIPAFPRAGKPATLRAAPHRAGDGRCPGRVRAHRRPALDRHARRAACGDARGAARTPGPLAGIHRDARQPRPGAHPIAHFPHPLGTFTQKLPAPALFKPRNMW